VGNLWAVLIISYMICAGDQFKESEMGRNFSTHGEKWIEEFVAETLRKETTWKA